MKLRWSLILALVAAVAGIGLSSSDGRATPGAGLTTTILSKARFGDIDLRARSHPALWRARVKTRGSSDVYVVDNKLAPGGTTGWHSHPGPSLVSVIAGSVTNYEGGPRHCPPHVYTAGTGFVDEGGTDVHMLRNEGSVTAETIAVQLLPQDAERRTDAAAPRSCPL